jgi:hypothetical protein
MWHLQRAKGLDHNILSHTLINSFSYFLARWQLRDKIAEHSAKMAP